MRILTLLLTGMLFMTSTVSYAADQSPSSPVLRKLANGLTVLVKEDDRFPLVSLRLYVHAGSTYETPDEAGISHMLEHMVFKGTEKRPKGQVAADIEGTGGYLNAATSFDYTVYLTDMTSGHWKTGLDVLKDMAFHPSLDPDELESEKDVVVAELKRSEDNPGQRLFRMTQQAALTGTPYFDPIIGYETTVRGLTAERIRDYIDRLYQPQSMLLVVCGNVTADEVMAEAQRLFGDLANSHAVTPPVSLAGSARRGGFTAQTEFGPWNKAYLSLALPVPGVQDLRSAQLDVLTQLLGGDATSRFYRKYKYEKRLVDGISISNYSFERLGMIYITVTLDADKIAPFWTEFANDLAGLSGLRFTDEELNRAKLNLEDDLFRSKETLAGYASKLGFFALFAGGEQGEANYLQAVRDTDHTVLAGLMEQTFRPEALSLVTLLPKGTELPEAFRAKGAPADWVSWFESALAATWKTDDGIRQSDADKPGAGKQEIVDLGNGRTVVLTPDPTLPYTAANLVFTGGDTLLSPGEQGLGAFASSLLTKGAGSRSATQIEDYLSDRAAAFGASGGRQTFSLSLNAPARFTADMFALLGETLTTPAFSEEEAARVRENQTASITMREDQPTGLAFRRLFPFLFGDKHPYGFLQLGEKDRVAAFKASDARAFWERQVKQPWVLSVCGDFDRDAILKAAQSLPGPAAQERTPDAPAWSKDKTLDLHLADRNQGHLFLVFPTVGFGHEDEAALDVLQNVLAGQSGLLFRDLRDKQGLGYTVTAFPWKAEKAGALIFYIGTEPEKMEQAEQGFRAIIADLHKTPLDDAELTRGKNQIQGDYYRDHQSLASRSAEAAILTVLHRPLDAARKLVEAAQQVDAETLRAVATRYLQPDKVYIVKVLP